LEPYYEQAEKALRVRGGKRSQHHPPTKTDYPIPADRNVSPLESMLKQIGIVISDIPFSTSIHRAPSFVESRFGPYVLMTDSYIPSFQKSGFGNLISNATVTRLVVDSNGIVASAEIKDLDRNVKMLRARAYVIACGALESPRLLLLSRSSLFPNGIGNNHDLVGRCFMEHRETKLRGRVSIDWRTFNASPLRAQSYQFYRDFKSLGLGGMSLVFALESALHGLAIKSDELGKSLNEFTTRNLTIFVETEMKPLSENRVTLDKAIKDYFGSPGINLFLNESEQDLRTVERGSKIARKIFADLGVEQIEALPRNTWGHHHMGTCRMGDNARSSVVDRDLRVHGTKNLFIAGSSVFVTSGTANPTLTLTALSLKLADHLRSQLQKSGFPAPNIKHVSR
jgi:choline dehydrogenase-like flavoprotein